MKQWLIGFWGSEALNSSHSDCCFTHCRKCSHSIRLDVSNAWERERERDFTFMTNKFVRMKTNERAQRVQSFMHQSEPMKLKQLDMLLRLSAYQPACLSASACM